MPDARPPIDASATGVSTVSAARRSARSSAAAGADNPPGLDQAPERMRFEALHCAQQLQVINDRADVGVVTLWSTLRSVLRVLQKQGIDLAPETSRIAVIANLYGNGLSRMLRNLLWNPQIRYLLVLGQDLSGSKAALCNFFDYGLEVVDFLGAPMYRIVGTRHVIDGDVTPKDFKHRIDIRILGTLSDGATKAGARDFFAALPPLDSVARQRIDIPVSTVSIQRFPSDAGSHAIACDTPLDAWEELIFRLHRFGHRNRVSKRGVNGGYYEQERIELQNVHVSIQQPEEDAAEHLKMHQFSLDHLRTLQRKILNPDKPADQTYTYGNRLRGYFKGNSNSDTGTDTDTGAGSAPSIVDTLSVVSEKLRNQPESRHGYVTLWDSGRDLLSASGHPCLVSLFFRRFAAKLTLTATFRTHNAFDAWLPNAYGLIAIQRFVAERAQMERGAVTMISHSISLDPSAFSRSQAVASLRQTAMRVDRSSGKKTLRFDPNGSIKITVDAEAGELVVEHLYDDVTIYQYRAKSAEEMEQLLSRDCVVADVSHAFYVGRELTKAESRLREQLRARK